jgi:hypothetical protein
VGDVPLQVFLPFELKERLRKLAFDRRLSYRALIIEAVDSTFPEEPTRKKKSA